MPANLTKEKRLKIIRGLLTNPSIFYGREDSGIIDLLDYLFDLRARPSEDPRFNDAYGDAVQHLVNNSDWELEYVLLTRFDITEGDKIFKLLEYLVRADFQAPEQKRLDLVENINSSLNKEGYNLATSEFNDNDQPIFSISEFNPANKYPAGVIKNNINFYPNYDAAVLNDVRPKERNFFILNFREFRWWNDFSLQSRCNLIYKDSEGKFVNFGEIKIITNKSENYTKSKDENGTTTKAELEFKSGFLGSYFAKSMLPKEKLNKMKTFKDKNPLNASLDKSVIDTFINQQIKLLELLNQSRKVSLNKVKIPTSISSLITLKLGDTFQFFINHSKRHLAQIERIQTGMKKHSA